MFQMTHQFGKRTRFHVKHAGTKRFIVLDQISSGGRHNVFVKHTFTAVQKRQTGRCSHVKFLSFFIFDVVFMDQIIAQFRQRQQCQCVQDRYKIRKAMRIFLAVQQFAL